MPQIAPSSSAEITAASPDQAPDQSIVFADGLVGCQSWKNFLMMVDTDDVEMPVAILQSLDDPQVTLLVTDPARIEPLYAPQLSSQDRTAVGLDDPDHRRRWLVDRQSAWPTGR
jgi:flagellar assembly factor FliW